MLSISCNLIAKRYNKEVLFKGFDYTFDTNSKYVLTGSNSSGKSTLLKIIGGAISPTSGDIHYSLLDPKEQLFSFCSPEMHLLDDYTVGELFELHFQFKKPKISIKEQIENANLKSFLNKKYSELSSGLKNKVKLCLAVFTDTPALLLDEPCTNFDQANSDWYNAVIKDFCQDQLIIVASNQEIEYQFCTKRINLHHYKSTIK